MLHTQAAKRKKGGWRLFSSARHFKVRLYARYCTSIRHRKLHHSKKLKKGKMLLNRKAMDSIERLNQIIFRERDECIISESLCMFSYALGCSSMPWARSMGEYFKPALGEAWLSLRPTVLSPALIIGKPKNRKRPSNRF